MPERTGIVTRSGHICMVCGFLPTTKNKYRELQDHLVRKHFNDRIKQALPTRRPYLCPEPHCQIEGKDWQALMRHYTGKHGVLETFLKEIIGEGRALPPNPRHSAKVSPDILTTPKLHVAPTQEEIDKILESNLDPSKPIHRPEKAGTPVGRRKKRPAPVVPVDSGGSTGSQSPKSHQGEDSGQENAPQDEEEEAQYALVIKRSKTGLPGEDTYCLVDLKSVQLAQAPLNKGYIPNPETQLVQAKAAEGNNQLSVLTSPSIPIEAQSNPVPQIQLPTQPLDPQQVQLPQFVQEGLLHQQQQKAPPVILQAAAPPPYSQAQGEVQDRPPQQLLLSQQPLPPSELPVSSLPQVLFNEATQQLIVANSNLVPQQQIQQLQQHSHPVQILQQPGTEQYPQIQIVRADGETENCSIQQFIPDPMQEQDGAQGQQHFETSLSLPEQQSAQQQSVLIQQTVQDPTTKELTHIYIPEQPQGDQQQHQQQQGYIIQPQQMIVDAPQATYLPVYLTADGAPATEAIVPTTSATEPTTIMQPVTLSSEDHFHLPPSTASVSMPLASGSSYVPVSQPVCTAVVSTSQTETAPNSTPVSAPQGVLQLPTGEDVEPPQLTVQPGREQVATTANQQLLAAVCTAVAPVYEAQSIQTPASDKVIVEEVKAIPLETTSAHQGTSTMVTTATSTIMSATAQPEKPTMNNNNNNANSTNANLPEVKEIDFLNF